VAWWIEVVWSWGTSTSPPFYARRDPYTFPLSCRIYSSPFASCPKELLFGPGESSDDQSTRPARPDSKAVDLAVAEFGVEILTTIAVAQRGAAVDIATRDGASAEHVRILEHRYTLCVESQGAKG